MAPWEEGEAQWPLENENPDAQREAIMRKSSGGHKERSDNKTGPNQGSVGILWSVSLLLLPSPGKSAYADMGVEWAGVVLRWDGGGLG